VISLTNLPEPAPSVVFESEVEGLATVPQQTPLAVIIAPPSDVISPPLVAVVIVILVIDAVDRTANLTGSSFLQLKKRKIGNNNNDRKTAFFIIYFYYLINKYIIDHLIINILESF
jgi:hypothetical protein